MYINDEDWAVIIESVDRLEELRAQYNLNLDKMFKDMKGDRFDAHAHNERVGSITGSMLANIFALKTGIKYAKTATEKI